MTEFVIHWPLDHVSDPRGGSPDTAPVADDPLDYLAYLFGRMTLGDEPPIHLPLLPHQVTAYQWVRDQQKRGSKGAILQMYMGLGKTFVALACVAHAPGPTLVLCNRPVFHTLAQEIRKFFNRSPPPLQLVHLSLQSPFTHSLRFDHTHITLLTYDTLRQMAFATRDPHGTVARFWAAPWVWTIADESQRFANRNTKLWTAVRRLPRSGFRLCLTGTPMPNTHRDANTQFQFCGSPSVFQRRWEDVALTLPVCEEHLEKLEFRPTTQRVYDRLFARCRAVFAQFRQQAVTFSAVLACFRELRVASLCPHIFDAACEASAKFRRVLALVAREIPREDSVLIMTSLAVVVPHLSEYLHYHNIGHTCFTGKQSFIEQQRTLEAFQQGCPRILILTDVGKHGLNLTRANHVILMEPFWNHADRHQRVGRVHRIGQTKPVHVWALQTPGIDAQMVRIANRKAKQTMRELCALALG